MFTTEFAVMIIGLIINRELPPEELSLTREGTKCRRFSYCAHMYMVFTSVGWKRYIALYCCGPSHRTSTKSPLTIDNSMVIC